MDDAEGITGSTQDHACRAASSRIGNCHPERSEGSRFPTNEKMQVPCCAQDNSLKKETVPYASGRNALSSASVAESTAVFGNSGINHFTLPARISSCAIRQGLREMVSMTGGAPPCSCR